MMIWEVILVGGVAIENENYLRQTCDSTTNGPSGKFYNLYASDDYLVSRIVWYSSQISSMIVKVL